MKLPLVLVLMLLGMVARAETAKFPDPEEMSKLFGQPSDPEDGAWKFKAFYNLVEADKFLNSLPVTANARMFRGYVQTEEEVAEAKKQAEQVRLENKKREVEVEKCKKEVETMRKLYPELILLSCGDAMKLLVEPGGVYMQDRWIVHYQDLNKKP